VIRGKKVSDFRGAGARFSTGEQPWKSGPLGPGHLHLRAKIKEPIIPKALAVHNRAPKNGFAQ